MLQSVDVIEWEDGGEKGLTSTYAYLDYTAQDARCFEGLQVFQCRMPEVGFAQIIGYFYARLIEAAHQLLVGIAQGIDGSLRTRGTTQGGFIAAQIAVEAVAQLDHHMGKRHSFTS